MKIMKRLAAVLLALCLMVPCIQMSAEASDGIIFFSDLTGIKVGEEFTIKGSVKNRGGNLGTVEIQMQYDSTAMKYISGDNGVTDNGNGTITYSGTVEGKDLLEFNMTFEALIQGETRMKQISATVTSENGQTLDMEEGYADIAIEAGNGTTQNNEATSVQSSGKTIMVEKKEYQVATSFPSSVLPVGFEETDITYNGETVKGAKQEKGDLQLLYLLDSSNQGAFYIYNTDENTCSPMQMINLSENRSIILLDNVENVELPARYKKVELEIANDHSVHAWHDSQNDRFYLLYAVNTDGDKALYKYDSKDQTYQYYGKTSSASSSGTDVSNSVFQKVSTFAQDHIDYVLIGAAFVFLIFFILIIILAVKLHRRNLELDDVYDELDELNGKNEVGEGIKEEIPIVEEDKPAMQEEKEVPKVKTSTDEPEKEDGFDDFESYDDTSYEDYDDDFADYDSNENYDDGFDDYDSDEDYDDFDDYDLKEYDLDDDYDSDEDYELDEDDLDDDYESYKNGKNNRSSVKKQSNTDEDDDDFSIDFIDL